MNKLRFYREKTKLNQTQFALLVGISAPGINQLEQGKKLPSLKTAQRIIFVLRSKGFECSVDDVFPPEKMKKAS